MPVAHTEPAMEQRRRRRADPVHPPVVQHPRSRSPPHRSRVNSGNHRFPFDQRPTHLDPSETSSTSSTASSVASDGRRQSRRRRDSSRDRGPSRSRSRSHSNGRAMDPGDHTRPRHRQRRADTRLVETVKLPPPPPLTRQAALNAAKPNMHDHVIRLVQTRDFAMCGLAVAQNAFSLLLKQRPGHAAALQKGRGGFLNVDKLSGMIGTYRAFHNISSWVNVYQTFKQGHAEHLKADGVMHGIVWLFHLVFVGYLFGEGAGFLGGANVLRLSRNPLRHKTRCQALDRASIRFWLATVFITFAKSLREAHLDKKAQAAQIERKKLTFERIKRRERRAARAGRPLRHRRTREEIAQEVDDSSFWADMQKRRITRKRQTIFDTIWIPGAAHLCFKNSPLQGLDNVSGIVAYLAKLRWLWRDSRMPKP